LLGGLSVIASMSAAQLDPVHEADARFFKCDRSCWKGGLRSARFTNAHCRRPSAPVRKMAADPVQSGGQAAPDWMSAFSRHVSIMHLLSLGNEHHDARLPGLRCPCTSRWPGHASGGCLPRCV